MATRIEERGVRSLLFVPAHAPSKLMRALESGADALILDLEDSVEPTAKAEARRLAAQFLAEHAPRKNRPLLYVRVNGLDSGLTAADLAAVVPGAPDGLMLPKPRSGACVAAFAQAIEAEERRASLSVGGLRIIAIATETPEALLSMGSFVACDPRLAGLAGRRRPQHGPQRQLLPRRGGSAYAALRTGQNSLPDGGPRRWGSRHRRSVYGVSRSGWPRPRGPRGRTGRLLGKTRHPSRPSPSDQPGLHAIGRNEDGGRSHRGCVRRPGRPGRHLLAWPDAGQAPP